MRPRYTKHVRFDDIKVGENFCIDFAKCREYLTSYNDDLTRSFITKSKLERVKRKGLLYNYYIKEYYGSKNAIKMEGEIPQAMAELPIFYIKKGPTIVI